MPDTFAPDNGGYLAMKLNGDLSSYVMIPALPGSQMGNPSPLRKLFLAGNSGYEPINQFRSVSQPSFLCNTLAYGGANGFFKHGILQNMITRGANGYLGSLGKVKARYGSGQGGDWSESHAQAKLGMLEISGGAGGSPVGVRMLAQMYGGEDATALSGTMPTDADLYMTEGVTFNGLLSGVEAWSISVNNMLRPRLVVPYPAGMTGAKGELYCPEYDNGPMAFVLTLVQRLGAGDVIDTTLGTVSVIKIKCVSQDPVTPVPVVATMSVQQPTKQATFQLDGVGYISRTYGNLAQNGSTASLAFAAT